MIYYIGESEDGKVFRNCYEGCNLLSRVIGAISSDFEGISTVLLGEVKDLHASDGVKVNGLYRKLKHKDNGEVVYIITLESEVGEFFKVAAFVDEFAHHLSQQDHGGNLYSLYYHDLKRRVLALC